MVYNPDLILTSENRLDVITALDIPYDVAAHVPNVALANLYHARGDAPSPAQLAGAEMLAALVAGLQSTPVTPVAPPAPSSRLTHYRAPLVTQIATLGHPILLVGPAGCGKTTIGEHAADTLGLPFYITSTINDTHELMGFVDGHGRYHDTPFRQAFEHGGLWIADEIDAWDASALLAANSALANGYANFPDRSTRVNRHINFRMIATANTFGTGADRIYVGRNELDAASLDRFASITVDYDLTLERFIARGSDEWLEHVWNVRRQVNEKKIRHVVSSRAVGMGAAALDAGLTWDDVNDIYLFKGMSQTDRSKIRE